MTTHRLPAGAETPPERSPAGTPAPAHGGLPSPEVALVRDHTHPAGPTPVEVASHPGRDTRPTCPPWCEVEHTGANSESLIRIHQRVRTHPALDRWSVLLWRVDGRDETGDAHLRVSGDVPLSGCAEFALALEDALAWVSAEWSR